MSPRTFNRYVKGVQMISSHLALKLTAIVTATLLATVTLAEDMTLTGPSSDCLSRANAQLSIEMATCGGKYPVSSQLYGECIAGAQQAYVGAIKWCAYVSGVKISGARGSELARHKGLSLKRQ